MEARGDERCKVSKVHLTHDYFSVMHYEIGIITST